MLVTRSGRRVTRGPIVVHALLGGAGAGPGDTAGRGSSREASAPPPGSPAPPAAPTTARAGFVVGRKVGNAVTRNRVRRRLREQVRSRLDRVPANGLVVVRALPSAAGASSEDLGRALDAALRALIPAAAVPGAAVGARPGRLPRPEAP